MDRRTAVASSRRSSSVAADLDAVWSVVAGAGPGSHWYVEALPLRFRAAVDRSLGGAGSRWPVPAHDLLRAGDTAGFWRVTRADGHRLDLEAVVRAPGRVRLTTQLAALPGAETRLTQQVSFAPSGLLGAAYLLADLPAREVVIELVHRRLLDDLASVGAA